MTNIEGITGYVPENEQPIPSPTYGFRYDPHTKSVSSLHTRHRASKFYKSIVENRFEGDWEAYISSVDHQINSTQDPQVKETLKRDIKRIRELAELDKATGISTL